MGAEPIPHELLLRHAGFLRRLARDLVGDPAAAEDAVQEVWLRALEKPPRHDANVRGWLRVVLTNLVRTKARGESRRAARERERAREPDAELFATNAGDEATLRSVTEAVLTLDEPLRSTVLQHYFQGLTAAEIAEREHLPVSTVKSRLQRALEILRVRLQRENGDRWQASLLALTVPSKIGKGVLLVSLKTKLAVVALVVTIGWLLLREVDGKEEHKARALADERIAELAHEPSAATRTGLDEAGPSGARAAILAVQPMPTASSKVVIFGTLTDREGQPIGGRISGGVEVIDERGEQHKTSSGEDGAYLLADLLPGRYWLTAWGQGFLGHEQVLDLVGTEPRVQRDFMLQSRPTALVYATTPAGEDLFEALRGLEENSHRPLVAVATETSPGDWFTELRASLNNPFGAGQFLAQHHDGTPLPAGCMGLLELRHELPVFVSLVHGHRVLQTRELLPGQNEVRFVVSAQDVVASSASFRAQVVDARTGAPIPRAFMRFAANTVGGSTVLASDAEGRIVVRNHPPCELSVSFGASGHEFSPRRFRAEGGPELDLGRIELEPAIPFEARVVDEEGTVCNASFLFGAVNEQGEAAEIDEDSSYGTRAGVLQIKDFGPRLYVLRTGNHGWVADAGGTRPQRVSGNVLVDLRPGKAPVDLTIHLHWATPVALHVRDADESRLRFRVIDEHRLELVRGTFKGSQPRGLSLPPGSYRVQLLDAGGGLLSEKAVVLGSEPMTLELSR